MTHPVEIVQIPTRTLAVTRIRVAPEDQPTIGEKMGEAFATVAAGLGEAGITPAGPAYAYYERADGGFAVAAGFGVADPFTAPPGLERMEVGGCEVAHTTHVGPYSDLPSAYEDLQAEAARLGRAVDPDSPMWEEYWSGPDTPDEKTRTEVYWPVVTA